MIRRALILWERICLAILSKCFPGRVLRTDRTRGESTPTCWDYLPTRWQSRLPTPTYVGTQWHERYSGQLGYFPMVPQLTAPRIVESWRMITKGRNSKLLGPQRAFLQKQENWGLSSVVKYLPNMCKALNLIQSTKYRQTDRNNATPEDLCCLHKVWRCIPRISTLKVEAGLVSSRPV